jgi:hypothetical protein
MDDRPSLYTIGSDKKVSRVNTTATVPARPHI